MPSNSMVSLVTKLTVFENEIATRLTHLTYHQRLNLFWTYDCDYHVGDGAAFHFSMICFNLYSVTIWR